MAVSENMYLIQFKPSNSTLPYKTTSLNTYGTFNYLVPIWILFRLIMQFFMDHEFIMSPKADITQEDENMYPVSIKF